MDQRLKPCMLFSPSGIQNANPQMISPSKSGVVSHYGDKSSTSSDSDPQHSPTLKNTPVWLSSDVSFFLEDIVLTQLCWRLFP